MKRVSFFAALFLLIGLSSMGSGNMVTLKGTYIWNNNPSNPGDLHAEFTPTEAGKWDVAFHFQFNGRPNTYKGTAEGSLENGSLRGRVQNENKSRTFSFEGKIDHGRFSGAHSEHERDGETKTGTLELSRVSP